MQDVFNKYINYLEVERNSSPYTVRNYRTDLLDFFEFLKTRGITSLKNVDKHVLRDYLSHLMKRGIVKASVARKLSAIRSFFRYLVREEILPASPATATSSPKLDRRLPSFLTIEQVERLLSAPDLSTPQGLRDHAIMELLYASGLRVSELVSLDVEQVSLGNDELLVRGKGSKERLVLIGKPATAALNVYLHQGRAKLLEGGKSNALFIWRGGRRLTERRIQKILEGDATKAGIDRRVHPHLLRHTFATHLLDGGADLKVVQELLGHSSLSSTQIYTHVTQSQAKKVYMSAHPMAREKSDEPED
jgi:integrase/recombinase XerC